MSHSPEPWRNGQEHVLGHDDTPIVWKHPDDDCWHRCDASCVEAHKIEEANAGRIVACVNFLAGVPTELLNKLAEEDVADRVHRLAQHLNHERP